MLSLLFQQHMLYLTLNVGFIFVNNGTFLPFVVAVIKLLTLIFLCINSALNCVHKLISPYITVYTSLNRVVLSRVEASVFLLWEVCNISFTAHWSLMQVKFWFASCMVLRGQNCNLLCILILFHPLWNVLLSAPSVVQHIGISVISPKQKTLCWS